MGLDRPVFSWNVYDRARITDRTRFFCKKVYISPSFTIHKRFRYHGRRSLIYNEEAAMPACFHLSVVDTKIYDRRALDHPTAPPIFNVGSHNFLMQSLPRNRFDRSFRDGRNVIELSANPATSRKEGARSILLIRWR